MNFDLDVVDACLISLTVACVLAMLLVAVWQRSSSSSAGTPVTAERIPTMLEVRQRAQLDAELARQEVDEHRWVG